MTEPWTLSISELADLFRTGESDPVVAVEAFRRRIADRDPELNCYVAMNPTLEAEARRSAARWRDGAPLSALDGVPIAVKDNLVAAGMPATWGSAAYADDVCAADELPVARLRAAGAIVLGKTNTPEFAIDGYTSNALFGTTRNALNPELTPGGSSGGSASAVAAGMAMAALGTDGGGSIRRPAGYSGLYGLKPGIGAIPRSGGLPQVLLDFEVVGGLARSVADLRLLYDCMAGPDRRDPASRTYPRLPVSTGPLRILHVPTLAGQPCDRAILEASDRAAETMRGLGHRVQTAEMPADLAALNAIWPRIARIGLARMFDAAPHLAARASPPYLEMAAEGRTIPAVQLWEVLDIVQELRRVVAQIFADWDVVTMPCAAARPWAAAIPYPDTIDGQNVGPRGHAIYTGWVNAAGIPALAIPVGPPIEGIPVGVQLVADIGQEHRILGLGGDYERTVSDVARSGKGAAARGDVPIGPIRHRRQCDDLQITNPTGKDRRRMNDTAYMQEAIDLARENVANGGQPFGAVLVRNGEVVARAVNRMEVDNDPTAHAELVALRVAGAALGTTRLDGATVYASGQPCMMCLAAMRNAGITEIVIGYSDANGEAYGMSPAAITAELSRPLEAQDWATIRYLAPSDAADPEIYRLYAERSADKA